MTNHDLFLVALITQTKEIKGKKALQKLLYLGKALGAPINYHFIMHMFGPFSYEVAAKYSDWEQKGIIKEQKKETGTGFTYTTGNRAKVYSRLFGKRIESFRETVDKLVSPFGGKEPFELEVLATLHHLSRLLQKGEKSVTETQLLNVFKTEKGDKFSDEEIKEAYSLLKKAELV